MQQYIFVNFAPIKMIFKFYCYLNYICSYDKYTNKGDLGIYTKFIGFLVTDKQNLYRSFK